jgi:hypothetical protein
MNAETGIRITFVGDTATIFMSGRQRLESFNALGYATHCLDASRLRTRGLWADKILPRLFQLPASPGDVARYNAAVLQLAAQPAPHIAWFEWPRMLHPETLARLRQAWPESLFVCYQDDNPFGRRNEARIWRMFLHTIPDFDVHFVKRPSDVDEFKRRGAPHCFIHITGYYEPLFEASTDATPDKGVLFVGTALDHRVPFLEKLVLDHGIDVHIHGGKWERARRLARKRPELLHGHIGEREYVRAIREHKVTLGFVSSSNLDEYSGRSFEIPAAGGFLLAERTGMHSQLFAEGVEAEFFASVEECAAKIRHYLAHEEERRRIAGKGRERCQTACYGLRHRMAAAVKTLRPLLKMPVTDSPSLSL